jgi:hypothetical protein
MILNRKTLIEKKKTKKKKQNTILMNSALWEGFSKTPYSFSL